MSEYTTVYSVLEGVSEDGDTRKFNETFCVSKKHADEEAIRMARKSVGEWRRTPGGDAYLIRGLVSVVRCERNAIGGSFNPRTIYGDE